ncbi:MAG: hypothetical protein JWL59_2390 [Chthoniobacteraceae bacterium]|nr:hypothetical protein [Chthoniobacteraceae bacterium]
MTGGFRKRSSRFSRSPGNADEIKVATQESNLQTGYHPPKHQLRLPFFRGGEKVLLTDMVVNGNFD